MQQVGVNAVFNVNAFVKGANTYIQTLNTVNVQTSQMVQQMNSATQAGGSGFDMLGHIISQTVGNAISYITWRVIPDMISKIQELAGAVLTMGMDFEEEMAVMKSVVDDPNISMEQLGDAALAVGEDVTMLNASALGASKAITMLYKGGLSTATIFGDLNGYLAGTVPLTGALRTVFDFAASGVDVADAADLSVIALSTFGYEMETETQKAEFITRALDNMVRAANASVAEASDLAEAWKYVGPAAATAGYSVEDVNNALALLSNGGLQASTAGTSLNGMLVDLVETTAKSEAELKRLGVEVFNPMTGEMYPLVDIIGQFEVALKGASDRERIEALGKIFDIRGARAMNVLLREGVDGWNDMATATYEATSMQDQAAIRLDTLSGRVEILKSLLTTLGVEGFLSVTDALQTLADVAAEFITEHGPKLVDFFTFVGDAFNGLVLLITENEDFMDSIKDAFAAIAEGNFTDAFLNIQEAFAQMFGEGERMNWLADLVPILSDITAVGPQLAEGFAALTGGDISGGIETIGDALKTAFGEDVVGPIIDSVTSIIDTIMSLASGDLSGAIDSFKTAIGNIFGEDIEAKVGGVIDFITENFDVIVGVIAGVGAVLATLGIGSLVTTIVGAIGGIIAAVAAIASPFLAVAVAIGGVVAFIITYWDEIKAAFQTGVTIVSGVIDTITGIVGGFTPTIENIVGAIGDFFSRGAALLAPFVETFKQVFSSMGESGNTFGNALKNLWDSIKQLGATLASVMEPIRAIGDLFVELWEKIEPDVKQIYELLIPAFEMVGQILGVVAGIIAGVVISAFGILASTVTAVMNTVIEVIKGAIDVISSIVDVITGVFDVIIGAATMFIGVFTGMFTGNWETFQSGWAQLKDGVVGIIVGLWDTVVAFTKTALLGILTFVDSFVRSVVSFFTNLYETLVGGSIIPDMVNGIIEWFGNLVTSVIDFVTNLVAQVIAWFINLAAVVITTVSAFVSTVIDMFSTFVTNIVTFVTNLVTQVVQKFTNLVTLVVAKVVSLVSQVTSKLSELVKKGIELITEFVTKIVDKAKELPVKIVEVLNTVIGKVREFISKFKDVGSDMIGGLIDGIKAKAGELLDAAKGVVTGAVDAVRNLLDSKSPSKVFMEIGGGISQGMAIGIQNRSNDPLRALSGMVNSMTRMVNPAAAQSTVNNYSYTTLEINPTYSNYQSEAGLYYDAVAALSAVRN